MAQMVIKGIYSDRLWCANGRLAYDSGWRSNTIVLRCRILLAAFMINDATNGIQALQLGRGDPIWDSQTPLPADPGTTTQLVDNTPHSIRHTDLAFQYLDANSNIDPGPTHRIEIIANLGPGVPQPTDGSIYPLREFGLFGTFNNTPFMIDYIRHPLIEKDVSVTLERRVRLIF